MSAHYNGLLLAVCASLSLLVAGCSDRAPERAADPVTGAAAPQLAARQVKSDPDRTDETLWTWLGIAAKPVALPNGVQTGATVSPDLWQASEEALNFAGLASEDPLSGLIVTKWYSPPGKPDERLRVTVFVLSRALRSDSLAVGVEREVRSPGGEWQKAPVAREVGDNLDSAILLRARHIHAERYRDTTYN